MGKSPERAGEHHRRWANIFMASLATSGVDCTAAWLVNQNWGISNTVVTTLEHIPYITTSQSAMNVLVTGGLALTAATLASGFKWYRSANEIIKNYQ